MARVSKGTVFNLARILHSTTGMLLDLGFLQYSLERLLYIWWCARMSYCWCIECSWREIPD
jgi:hypothetical protein